MRMHCLQAALVRYKERTDKGSIRGLVTVIACSLTALRIFKIYGIKGRLKTMKAEPNGAWR